MISVLVDFSRGGIECRWWACLCAGARNAAAAAAAAAEVEGWAGFIPKFMFIFERATICSSWAWSGLGVGREGPLAEERFRTGVGAKDGASRLCILNPDLRDSSQLHNLMLCRTHQKVKRMGGGDKLDWRAPGGLGGWNPKLGTR